MDRRTLLAVSADGAVLGPGAPLSPARARRQATGTHPGGRHTRRCRRHCAGGLNKATQEASADAEVVTSLGNLNFTPFGTTTAAFVARIQHDNAELGPVVTASGFEVEEQRVTPSRLRAIDYLRGSRMERRGAGLVGDKPASMRSTRFS